MKNKLFISAILLMGLPLAAETIYTFNGASGIDYNWNTVDNWSEKTLPASDSTILIESGGLYNNSLVLENDITVKSIYWNVVKDNNRGNNAFSGGKTINAESFEVYQSFSTFKQFFNNAKFNLTNATGTGTLTVGSAGSGQWAFYFRASKINSDYIVINSGATIEQGSSSSLSSPAVTVNKLMTINSGGYYTTSSSTGTNYHKFGGLSGEGRIMSGGGTGISYVILTNQADATFRGLYTVTNAYDSSSDAMKSYLLMDETATATQYFSNAANTMSSVTVNGGEISMLAADAGVLSVAGGKLSVYNNLGTLTNGVLNGESLAWSDGTVGVTIGATDSSKIALTGALTKGDAAKNLTLALEFDADIISRILETSDSITRDIITYESTNFVANDSDVKILAPDGFNYSINFGDSALSVTITNVPESSTVAAIFGAIALLAVAIRRRK